MMALVKVDHLDETTAAARVAKLVDSTESKKVDSTVAMTAQQRADM